MCAGGGGGGGGGGGRGVSKGREEVGGGRGGGGGGGYLQNCYPTAEERVVFIRRCAISHPTSSQTLVILASICNRMVKR